MCLNSLIISNFNLCFNKLKMLIFTTICYNIIEIKIEVDDPQRKEQNNYGKNLYFWT